ncbi:hypothetical protein ANAEL_05125 [Anaerolineales bacterium]|nr:hypothetical protein ANAEL_05125 [Anaerolineales bacterium]
MKKIIPLFAFIFILGACDTLEVSPQPVATWIIPPSRTPSIVTATPIILTLPFTQTVNPGVTVIAPITLTNAEIPTATSSNTPPPTETPTPIPTATAIQSVAVDILGCNTGLDITHGMGEVTNAYVTVKNTGTVDLPNTCALLRAVDEDREHPDKKVCVPNLPVGNQVTLKLTVDSKYKLDTIIQVDASSNEFLLLRVDKPSCADLSVCGGAPTDLGVVKLIQ